MLLRIFFLLVLLLWQIPSSHAQAASVSFTWDDTTNTTQDGYVLQRRVNNSGSAYGEVLRTGKTARMATDSTVVDGQGYCYRLAAFRIVPVQTSPFTTPDLCLVAGTLLVAPVHFLMAVPVVP